MRDKHHIVNYIKAIDNATEENLHDILMDENQGKLTFVGMNFLPDLNISTPLELTWLWPGTLFYIRAEAWMLVEPRDGSSGVAFGYAAMAKSRATMNCTFMR